MNCPRCNGPATEETLREFGGVCPKCLLKFAEEKDAPAFPSLEIVEMIGQGGMGVVYKAVQKSLGRTVALKVLSPQLSSDPEFVERFTREAKALAQLSHPNIVAIHDSGIHDKVPYLVMEFVEGKSLRQLLASRELTAPQALELVPQICDALYYAHSKGVVHRDIKPENILIDAQGRVKIADYGLAKIASLDQPRITKTNIAMGTPHYMAPEQIEKTSEVDHRADIYSLGVVIYEMLTGELPLGRFKPPSEKAEIDRRLDRVVLKSLEKEPADRYQSADEVKSQFARLDQTAPSAAPAPVRLSKLAVTSGVLCLGGLVTALAATIVSMNDMADGAGATFFVAAACWFASIAFSICSFFVILLSRGTLRGLWIPILSGISSALLLLISVVVLFVGAAPVAQSSSAGTAAPRHAQRLLKDGLTLKQGWPDAKDLPYGLYFETLSRDAEALRRAAVPALKPGDVGRAMRATLANGQVELLGFEMNSETEREAWEQAPGVEAWINGWRHKAFGGKTVILLRDGNAPDAQSKGDEVWDLVRTGVYSSGR